MAKKTKIIKAYDIMIDELQFSLSPANSQYYLWRTKAGAKQRAEQLTVSSEIKIIQVEIHIPLSPAPRATRRKQL